MKKTEIKNIKNLKSKVFKLDCEKEFKKAERFKLDLENEGFKVEITNLHRNFIKIEGFK